MRVPGLHIFSLVFWPQILATGIRSGNRALNKPSRQSSTKVHTRYNGKASNAVDGIADEDLFKHSCTHTKDLEREGGGLPYLFGMSVFDLDSSWWEVDLEEQVIIRDIRILNRNSNSQRLHDVRVDVSETVTLPRKRKPCTTYKGPAKRGWVNLTCDLSVSGRVVRLTKPYSSRSDVLTLCEVEIYGPNGDVGESMLTPQDAGDLSYRNCCSVCH